MGSRQSSGVNPFTGRGRVSWALGWEAEAYATPTAWRLRPPTPRTLVTALNNLQEFLFVLCLGENFDFI